MRSVAIRLLAACTLTLHAQQASDPFLQRLTGHWNASGTMGGDPVGYRINASWVLNDRFLLIDLSDTAKVPQYQAQVYIGYDSLSERYVAHWLDSFGARFAETLGYGTRTGDTLSFRFEYPDGPFINAFMFDPAARSWRMHCTTKNSKGDRVVFGDIRSEAVER